MIVHCFWQSLFKTSPESIWQNFSLCEWSLMRCFVERKLFHVNKHQKEKLTQTSNTLRRILKWYFFLECCFLMIPSLSDDVFLQGFFNILPLHWRSPQIITTREKGWLNYRLCKERYKNVSFPLILILSLALPTSGNRFFEMQVWFWRRRTQLKREGGNF